MMRFADVILPEFDQEMANTRKVFEQLPEDKMDWKPHPKSHTIGWNANHIAEMPGWVENILTEDSFDFAPVGGERYQTPTYSTRKEILEFFDKNVAEARKAIAAAKDEELSKPWTLLDGGKPVITMPRAAVFRTFVISHIIHHRAILCVYLRLNDIPVPGMYGPSGDETN
jgi:uncharacterized damage-inducible protein DinB